MGDALVGSGGAHGPGRLSDKTASYTGHENGAELQVPAQEVHLVTDAALEMLTEIRLEMTEWDTDGLHRWRAPAASFRRGHGRHAVVLADLHQHRTADA